MNPRLGLLYVGIILLVVFRIFSFQPPELRDGAKIDSRVRLLSSPVVRGNTKQLVIFLKDQRVTLIVSRFSEYSYGDLLHISGTLKRKVLDDQRIVYSIYFPMITIIKDDPGAPFHVAGFIRERVEEAFSYYLSADHAGLLMGIVFGISGGLDREQKSQFQIAGVTHVIAASGMNVTLLAGFLLPLFLRITNRRDALLLTIISLGLYAIISGLSASILRAALMGSIGLFGLMVGRQKTAVVSFFITGCIMILITPSVIVDIGFQLSFIATAGMLLIMPLLSRLPKLPVMGLVKEDLAATLSAQIATMPLLLFYFHSLGLLSVIVNVLVLWTIPPLMIIGSFAAILSLINLSLGGLIALIALPFLSYFMLIVDIFASISPIFQVESLPLSIVLGYYLLLVALLAHLIKRKNQPGL